MPRKKKSESDRPAAEVQNGAAASAQSPARGRVAAKTPATTAKKSGRKSATPRKPKTAGAVSTAREPSNDEISLRAYFIAERRHRLALAGDADSDWLEAKRQLLIEIKG